MKQREKFKRLRAKHDKLVAEFDDFEARHDAALAKVREFRVSAPIRGRPPILLDQENIPPTPHPTEVTFCMNFNKDAYTQTM
jgi:hypothetical protein